VGRGRISGGDGRRHFRRGGAFGYVPYGYDDGPYGYYDGGCRYYYRRAVATGSSYWWNRYYDCVGD
jgi:hypothetical protein